MRLLGFLFALVPAWAFAFGVPKPLPVLDHLSGLPAACYSVRVLERAQYQQPLLVERRSSDNTTRNIYYLPGGKIDWPDEVAFAGTGNAFIVTFDNQCQLGSVANVTQTTAADQPQLVANGQIESVNGVASPLSNVSSSLVTTSNFGLAGTSAFYFNAVEYNTSPTGGYPTAVQLTSSTSYLGWNTYGEIRFLAGSGGTVTGLAYVGSGLFIHTGISTGSNTQAYANGTSQGTGTAGSNTNSTLEIMYAFPGYVPETIIGETILSAADQQTLEPSQGIFFNIFGVTK